jgi:hypothetical protein
MKEISLCFTVAFNLHRAVLDCCLSLRDLCNLAGVGASAGASVEVPSNGESYGVLRRTAQGSVLTNSQLRFLARAFRLFAAEKFHVTFHYTVKKLFDVPVPSRDVTSKTFSWAGIMTSYINYYRLRRVWLVTSQLGTGISKSLFYGVCVFCKDKHKAN